VTEAGAGRLPLILDVNEFTSDDFAVHGGRLEVPELCVVQFVALLKFTSEIVDTLKYLINLANVEDVLVLLGDDGARCALGEEVNRCAGELDLRPLVVIEVVRQHVLADEAVL